MNENATKLSINTDVIEKMAELAAKEIEGVTGLSNKAVDLKNVVKTKKPFKGVKVESVNGAIKIVAYICVDNNAVVKDVAEKVQANIKEKVQTMTGVAVTKVNVSVADVHIEDEAAEEYYLFPKQSSPIVWEFFRRRFIFLLQQKIICCIIYSQIYSKQRGRSFMSEKTRLVGTVSRGIRCPIIREGDNLAEIVSDSVLAAAESEGFALRDRDVICMTESIVARAQGNYATVENIAKDVKAKLGGKTIGVIFTILSRNRFAICLKGIAMGAEKIVLMLSYPSDEVGNSLATYDLIDEAGINPYSDVLSLERYREVFGVQKLEFTGVDYVEYYENLIKECGAEVEIIFANQPKAILDYTDCVLTCDIHTRERTKRLLKKAGAKVVCGLDDILNAPVDSSGCNEMYGLLGSNKST